jgi:hypothetical protein
MREAILRFTTPDRFDCWPLLAGLLAFDYYDAAHFFRVTAVCDL